MPRQFLFWMICGTLGGGVLLAAASLWWKRSAQADSRPPPTVYVCRKTGELFVGKGKPGPQIHPDTGLATLFPGLYCPQCGVWKASPPSERLFRHPELLNCPSCKSPRRFDGDVPEGTPEL
jgi:rubredoxin